MSLRAIQQDLREWLTQESAAAAARLGEPAAPGLAVYLNNYRGSLMACLAETFSTVHGWLGDGAFAAAAATHIERVPPSSWTLDDYARDFPDTLRALYPTDPEVAELADLDRVLAEVYTGADCESVAPEGLAQVDWDQARLRLVPSFTLLPCATNAAAIWTALNEQAPPPAAELLALPTQLAVWRAGYTPRFRTLDPAEAQELRAIAAGEHFGQLCARLVERQGPEAGPTLAGAWLGQWLRDGFIAAVT